MENLKKRSGIFEDYLIKNEKNNISRVTNDQKKGKFASLDYEVLKYNEELNLSVVKINLHTGRHHQIRVQLSSRDHSIYGDQKYSGRGHGLGLYEVRKILNRNNNLNLFTTKNSEYFRQQLEIYY